jgi:drug/metabolite transporter (DMT)-like permease
MLILLTVVLKECLRWQAVLGILIAMLGVAVLFLE